ncbi:MAG: DUF4388 domain-containing protein [Candidatus Hydrothermales bacterium]
MGLEGTLEDFELTDILQIIQMGKKNGLLLIEHPSGEKAKIYIENSRVVHAECGGEYDELAMAKIFEWNKGKFKFEVGQIAPKKTIDMPIPTLIMEAARKIDEWNRIKKVIPSLETIFELEPNPTTDLEIISLNADEWRVLSQIDGKKNIKEIANILRMGEIETAKILFGLIGLGLIRIKRIEKIEKAPEFERKVKEEKKEREEKKDKGLFGFFKKK